MALAALGVALSASPAFAFDHHFRVVPRLHRLHFFKPGRFRFKATYFDARSGHRKDRIGRSHAKCKIPGDKVKCRLVIHLNGKIGGFGDMTVRGNLTNRGNVVGGTHDFNGAAGKLLVHPHVWHFDLTR